MFSIESIVICNVMEAISRKFRVALPWELLYADDLVATAEIENDLMNRLTSERMTRWIEAWE